MKRTNNQDTHFLITHIPKYLVLLNGILLGIYFYVITYWFSVSNLILFIVLLCGQAYYMWQGLSHMYTIWDMNYQFPKRLPVDTDVAAVDVFITVAGEPISVIRETVMAAKAMTYGNFQTYILNDGFVAKKDNWQEVERLAEELGVVCITRTVPGGAKAGNINHALTQTDAPFVVIFDADHVPKKEFLQTMMSYVADENVGFVQSPQYYKNHTENLITAAAWEQQQLFFGAICKGKNRLNATTMCGTNMVIRRKALEAVGGICDTNIAEDFITGMFIHEKGWTSVYVPEVLALGLAPEDFVSYYKQQLRWARGSIEVFVHFNPLFRKGLSWPQRIQYLSSAGYYLSGVIVLLHAVIPLVFFFSGQVPFLSSTMALVAAFLPYMFLTIYNLQYSTHFTYTFRALSFSMSSFWIHITAFIETIIGKKRGFAITSKTKIDGNFVYLIIPHLIYIVLVIAGITVAVFREGITPSLITNISWSALYIITFIPFIQAAVSEPHKLVIAIRNQIYNLSRIPQYVTSRITTKR